MVVLDDLPKTSIYGGYRGEVAGIGFDIGVIGS